MSLTIVTKYLGPTNTRGSRISAKFADCKGSIFWPYDSALDALENHIAAARALINKTWGGYYAIGSGATLHVGQNKTGYVLILNAYKI